MPNKNLIIIGLSNNAKLAAYYFSRDTNYKVVGFAVDRAYKEVDEFYKLPVYAIEDLDTIYGPDEADAFVAVGYQQMNSIREILYNKIKSMGYFLPNYISPKCSFLTELGIGDNNFILEDNTIQPFVKIGNNNVLWSGNHIGHDVAIGNNNFISSHVVISGFTKIENNCFFGVNSTLRDNITIGNKALIAAGAVIMKSVNPGEVYLGPKAVLFDKSSDELKIS
jgi:sugar O-acyltransferase (sialic acid O-acetyltransferase NeuD family)